MSPKATNNLILDLELHAVRESSPVPLSSLTGSGRVDKLSETTGEGYVENPSGKVAATESHTKGGGAGARTIARSYHRVPA